eukprot:5210810-Pleurochrysis_carterae.AAC.3
MKFHVLENKHCRFQISVVLKLACSMPFGKSQAYADDIRRDARHLTTAAGAETEEQKPAVFVDEQQQDVYDSLMIDGCPLSKGWILARKLRQKSAVASRRLSNCLVLFLV